MQKIKYTMNCKLMEENQNDQYKKYSVFYGLQDGSKQKVCSFYGLRFSILMTSQLQTLQIFLKCWNSENDFDIGNALSGIMADDLKFPSIYSVARMRR